MATAENSLVTNRKAVRVLFPALTHMGRIYDVGDIENEPSEWLYNAAKSKTKMFHRDSNKELRVARLVRNEKDGFEKELAVEDEDEYEVTPKSIDDDLLVAKKPELLLLAYDFGLKERNAKNLNNEQLGKLITFMRKL